MMEAPGQGHIIGIGLAASPAVMPSAAPPGDRLLLLCPMQKRAKDMPSAAQPDVLPKLLLCMSFHPTHSHVLKAIAR